MKPIASVVLLLLAFTADARIGGGQSYSGDSGSSSSSSSSSPGSSGSSSYSDDDDSDSRESRRRRTESSSSGSSSGRGSSPPARHPSGGGSSGGAAAAVLGVGMVLFMFTGVVILAAGASRLSTGGAPVTITAAASLPPAADLTQLRAFDPNFSEIVFTDFCYSLFARLYEARGRGRLDDYALFVAPAVREALRRHSPPGLTSVDGIVIGSSTVIALRGLDQPQVAVDVELEANYTESSSAGTRRWYVREVWTLVRMRNTLSPRPERARAEHCPQCGAPLETRTDGACLHCGAHNTAGTLQWYLQAIRALKKDARPPQLGGSSGPEPGLDRPTVLQPWLGRHGEVFVQRNPGFTWQGFYERVYFVAEELQAAWTARDWNRARPFETDALFQTHRYWIDEYLRQGLRNVVDGYQVDHIEVAKIASDAFYDAITVRLLASGSDFTVNEAGVVVGGSPQTRRQWSEYWTFIRGRAGAPADARVCPNCGGSLDEGQTAICAWCGGKVTTGDFPWVLSRIEQDEAYRC